MEKAQFFPI
jgi:hypothetical protein